ncbi:MAG TPA: PIN domain-containing protein [Acidimicrobiales bacterium]|nr:PIN domain-containing protein [Acidimicrobiales bacterium]
MTVVYDAGALIAAERSDRAVWADHRARLELGVAPVTTAPVVAQASRSGQQAQLRRLLRGCEMVPFLEDEAHDIGALAGKSASADVVDVHVVAVAHRHGFGVLTSDEKDLRPIVAALRSQTPLFRV